MFHCCRCSTTQLQGPMKHLQIWSKTCFIVVDVPQLNYRAVLQALQAGWTCQSHLRSTCSMRDSKIFVQRRTGRKCRNWQFYECSLAWQVPPQHEMSSASYMANILKFWGENYCSVQRRNATVHDETMQDWWVFLQYKLGADC